MSEDPERTVVPSASTKEENEGKAWAYCPDCGTPVAGKRFCPTCGRAVGAEAPAPPPAAEPAPVTAPAPSTAPIPIAEAPPAPVPAVKAPPAPARTAPPSLDHPGLAFALEFVPGLLGFLGVGWLSARRGPVGLGLMLGWWGVLILAIGITVFLRFGEICCFLWLPFHVSIPLISAFVIAGEARQARRRRLMGL